MQDIEERKQYLLNNTLASTKSLYEELGFKTQFVTKEDDDLNLRNLPKSVSLCKLRFLRTNELT